jgi:hypothetical protein
MRNRRGGYEPGQFHSGTESHVVAVALLQKYRQGYELAALRCGRRAMMRIAVAEPRLMS